MIRRSHVDWLPYLCLAACATATPAASAGSSRQVGAARFDERLPPGALGGVTHVLRYAVAQPDRSETAYVFLTSALAPGGLAEQVQVVGRGGEALQLSDTQGSDCTLERVWIRERGQGGPQVVYARRTFSGDLKTDDTSQPAAMEVSVFRPVRGAEPGDSAVMLRIVGAPRRSRPVCRARDVRGEMERLSMAGGPAR